MAKQLSHYVCQKCGWETAKWQGQCTQCQEWNTLVETLIAPKFPSSRAKVPSGQIIKPQKLSEIKSQTFQRIKTGIGELDRVLGNGIVPGSLVLVAGEPGIGKSTLLTQLALSLNSQTLKLSNAILYICGEESPNQIKLRIDRMASKTTQNIFFLPETNLENLLTTISSDTQVYNLIIIDSIQTIWTERLTGTAGSVGQVRECSQMLLTLAKKANLPIFLIGHITKEGTVAGPKVLEHLVDTVLTLEGDREHDFRILRATKNRFGSCDEVGIFTMTDQGMMEVKDPSKIFISPNSKTLKLSNSKTLVSSGSAITVSMQGLRPMLVEIQALVVPTRLPMPRRVAQGISFQKLQVISAVLQKRLHLPLDQSDIFVSVAGGLKLKEPAADLAICLAIISSFKNKPLPLKTVALGEVGLLGEIRKVAFWDKRIKESKKLGYKLVIGEKEQYLNQVVKYLA